MSTARLRVGLIGAGANTRARHIPGLLALPGVELVSVCNRRPESTAAAAAEFGIPRTRERWEDVVDDPDVDAVVIGTWPYLHHPITLAALATGKHVLTEARMSLDAAEARAMLAAARENPRLVAQVVPSPYGLLGDAVVRRLLDAGFLGTLREAVVVGRNAALADPAAPLGWRQDRTLSGVNALALGILHETLLRWVPPPTEVVAQAHAFVPSRVDPHSGVRRAVETPDSLQALAVLEGGARATYQLSGVTPYGQETSITLYGDSGVLRYDLEADHLSGFGRGSKGEAKAALLAEIPVPAEEAGGWRVEADWVRSIREGTPVRLTNFAAGVAYMEFTEAVARSAQEGVAVDVPPVDEE